MRTDELPSLVANDSLWEPLGEGEYGEYNVVFKSKSRLEINGLSCHWVRKKPIPHWAQDEQHLALNAPSRAVRKWSELNPYPAYEVGEYWISPYLGKRPSSDEDMANKILRTFHEAGTVIVDLFGTGNCLNTPFGDFCVDVDMALRPGSPTSDVYLKEFEVESYRVLYDKYFADYRLSHPESVFVARNLLYLIRHIPAESIPRSRVTRDVMLQLDYFRQTDASITPDVLELLIENDQQTTPTIDGVLRVLTRTEDPAILYPLCVYFLQQNLPFEQFLIINEALTVLARQGGFKTVIDGECHLIHLLAAEGKTNQLSNIINALNRDNHHAGSFNLALSFFFSEETCCPAKAGFINAEDDTGRTPLDWALMCNHRKTADFLRGIGAVRAIEREVYDEDAALAVELSQAPAFTL